MDNILQHLQDENIEVVEMVDELDAEEFAHEARRASTSRHVHGMQRPSELPTNSPDSPPAPRE
jgi:hypothetical protein